MDDLKKKIIEEYWLKKLDGEFPPVTLNFSGSLPAGKKGGREQTQWEIPEPAARVLRKTAKDSDMGLFILVMGALFMVLHKYTGLEDLVVGTVSPQKTGTEDTILFCRCAVTGDLVFKDLIGGVKGAVLEAINYGDYSFDEIFRQLEARKGEDSFYLLNAALIFEKIQDRGRRLDPFNLVMVLQEEGDRLSLQAEYDPAFYSPDVVRELGRNLIHVYEDVSAKWETELSKIDVVRPEEKDRLLYDFNRTRVDYPRDKTITESVAAQVERVPENTALVYHHVRSGSGGPFSRTSLSYKELWKKTASLAGILRQGGVESGTIVGILVERSLEMMVGILGILRAGGAYLPIDHLYPEERIAYILEDSGVDLLLTREALGAAFRDRCRLLDLQDEGTYSGTLGNLEEMGTPRDVAYVTYTSGSTGKPKGVMIENRAVVNFIKGITDIVPFGEEDCILSLTTISFDIFGLETILPLTRGSRVVVGNEEEQLYGSAIASAVEREKVTIFQVTPSRLKLLLEDGESGKILDSLKYLLVGGEAFPDRLLEQTRELCPPGSRVEIFNLYGPTETTIWSTVKRVTAVASVNIGSPIANTSIFILSRNGLAQPLGVAGELWIGGDGLSRGYLNRPEITRERFAPHPFARGERLYRTGDLARWLPDGDIEFLGREDYQVKLRGYRIELGEIECRLLEHPAVKEVVVMDRENSLGQRELCAYVVPDRQYSGNSRQSSDPGIGETANRLREFLSARLPDYMIPSYFVSLEKIPLTANGKIDRQALPDPAIEAGEEYVAPRNRVEKQLVEMYAEVLAVAEDSIGIDASFFNLGGHSLKAIMLISNLHRAFNVKMPLTEFFRVPTIRALAEYLEGAAESVYSSIEPAAEKEYYKMSSAQKRVFVQQQMDPESTAYNMYLTVVLEGEVKKGRLEETFEKLIGRHESFRTSFGIVENRHVQRIHPPSEVRFSLELHRLAGKSENETVHRQSVEEVVDAFIRPFDLESVPLLRAGLVEIGKKKYLLMVDVHHIVIDGVSHDILVRDFTALYLGHELSPLEIQYKDYSEWQNSREQMEAIQRQEEYWLEEFRGEIPLLELPTDYPRPPVQSRQGAMVNFEINKPLTERLKALVSETETTLYIVLLAVTYILLSRYTHRESMVVGSPVIGRRHPELQEIIGIFINMLAIRAEPAGEKTFCRFLKELKEKAVRSYENQDFQFEELIHKLGIPRATDRHPLFTVVFELVYENDLETAAPGGPLGKGNGLKLYPYEHEYRTSKFDLLFGARELKDWIHVHIEYATALFKRSTVEKMAARYVGILEQVVENREIKVKDIVLAHDLLTVESVVVEEDQEGFDF